MRSTALALPGMLLAAIIVAGCSAETVIEQPRDSAAVGGDVPELAGTSWRLVEILSMDDTKWVPEDSSDYTLEFRARDVSIVADCNRGTGAYTSEAPGKLQFGVIAATQAMCLPGSLHDVYMKQFPWVRSYVLEDGHLFLATMADGSIIEFEPVP